MFEVRRVLFGNSLDKKILTFQLGLNIYSGSFILNVSINAVV
jgi:hypothetical protein